MSTLTSLLGIGSLRDVATSGSKMVDAVVTSKNVVPVPVSSTQVIEDSGKIFPSPNVVMTPQESVFKTEVVTDPVLYSGKTVLTPVIDNTGIVGPTLSLVEPRPVDYVYNKNIDTTQPLDGKYFLLLNQSNGVNGIYKQDSPGVWRLSGQQGIKGDRIYASNTGETYQYDGTKWRRESSPGVLEPETILDKVTDTAKTATGLAIEPIYIILAIVALVGVWFAWKKGYLKV